MVVKVSAYDGLVHYRSGEYCFHYKQSCIDGRERHQPAPVVQDSDQGSGQCEQDVEQIDRTGHRVMEQLSRPAAQMQQNSEAVFICL